MECKEINFFLIQGKVLRDSVYVSPLFKDSFYIQARVCLINYERDSLSLKTIVLHTVVRQLCIVKIIFLFFRYYYNA